MRHTCDVCACSVLCVCACGYSTCVTSACDNVHVHVVCMCVGASHLCDMCMCV